MHDRRNSPPRQILVSLFCLFALGYFAYHAVVGKRGLEARTRLVERSRELKPKIARLEAVRSRLERDIRFSTPQIQTSSKSWRSSFWALPASGIALWSSQVRVPSRRPDTPPTGR